MSWCSASLQPVADAACGVAIAEFSCSPETGGAPSTAGADVGHRCGCGCAAGGGGLYRNVQYVFHAQIPVTTRHHSVEENNYHGRFRGGYRSRVRGRYGDRNREGYSDRFHDAARSPPAGRRPTRVHHMTHDLCWITFHVSPDIPMSLMQTFLALRFQIGTIASV